MFQTFANTEILLEENSMNTVENAVFSMNILFRRFPQPQLFDFNLHLVTSEYHCKRAEVTFIKVIEQIKLKYPYFNLLNV